MRMETFAHGEGALRVEGVLVVTENGIQLGLFTSGHSHVGAVALAVPRPSLRDPGRLSSTASVMTVPSHEDDVPARKIARLVASRTDTPCSVTCGLHVDAADEAEVATLVDNACVVGGLAAEHALRERAAWRNGGHVIAVDEDGRDVGSVDLDAAHSGEGVLHRAFSILLVDGEGRFVLCRRSERKRLWGGVLGDTCAGHVLAGEGVVEAAQRRLVEEMGCLEELRAVGHVVYRAEHGDKGCECEYCTILVGRAHGSLHPNPEEVSEVVPVSFDGLLRLGSEGTLVPWLARALADDEVRAALAVATGGGRGSRPAPYPTRDIT